MAERAPVSVVIPCYRCADTVARAVKSVVDQSLAPAEILLVENASGDSGVTLAALRALQSTYGANLIRIIEMEHNTGAAGARNAGWDAATQPYVAFLDADDAWHPEKLSIQYCWMAQHPEVQICGHQIQVVSSLDELPHPRQPVANRIGRPAWLLSCRFSVISVMLRRELPFRFEPAKRHAEDYLLWLRIALHGYDAWRIEAPLACCFKPLYGGGGLSRNLWQLEKGELDTYRRIWREHLISLPLLVGLTLYSLLKHLRRMALVSLRGH